MQLSSTASQLKASFPPDVQRAMDLSQENDASNSLTVLPVEELGFSLLKGAFRVALALRYSWFLHNTSSRCSCGTNFTVEHSLSCSKGGYPSIRHNEIRDFTAYLMTEVGVGYFHSDGCGDVIIYHMIVSAVRTCHAEP